MGHSYKHTPYSGDHKGKIKKRFANKKVRSLLKDEDVILSNSDYKKVYCQYDICDFYTIRPWNEYWQSCLIHDAWMKQHFPNKDIAEPNDEEEYKKWYKWFKMK